MKPRRASILDRLDNYNFQCPLPNQQLCFPSAVFFVVMSRNSWHFKTCASEKFRFTSEWAHLCCVMKVGSEVALTFCYLPNWTRPAQICNMLPARQHADHMIALAHMPWAAAESKVPAVATHQRLDELSDTEWWERWCRSGSKVRLYNYI